MYAICFRSYELFYLRFDLPLGDGHIANRAKGDTGDTADVLESFFLRGSQLGPIALMINGVNRCVDVVSIQTHPQGDFGVNPRTIGVFAELFFDLLKILLIARPEIIVFRERELFDP